MANPSKPNEHSAPWRQAGCSRSRLCLEGFLLSGLKGAGQWKSALGGSPSIRPAVPPVAPSGFTQLNLAKLS
eukprot:670237-Pyramimonas_sp.AAC.1